ncbi:unnamed protein product, partial [Brenthis ino]
MLLRRKMKPAEKRGWREEEQRGDEMRGEEKTDEEDRRRRFAKKNCKRQAKSQQQAPLFSLLSAPLLSSPFSFIFVQ